MEGFQIVLVEITMKSRGISCVVTLNWQSAGLQVWNPIASKVKAQRYQGLTYMYYYAKTHLLCDNKGNIYMHERQRDLGKLPEDTTGHVILHPPLRLPLPLPRILKKVGPVKIFH